MAARPHQQIITYEEPTGTGHYGRNGVMQAHGIIVEVFGGETHLVGLVSRERRSGAARLSVPFDALPQLIAALQAVADGK
jgi:hypothetical protein